MQYNRLGIIKRIILSKKFEKAKKLLRPLAESNNTGAQLLLGYLYFGGDLRMSWEESQKWLRKSAQLGNPEAMALVSATDFRQGIWTTTPESKKGLKLLEVSAICGSAEAQRNLACTYAVGEAVPYDPVKATYWYTKAAENDYGEAQNDIACMWLDGEAGYVDLDKAIFWYKKCASSDEKIPYAQWASEGLRDIYAGKYDQNYLNEKLSSYWGSRAEYLDKLEFSPHPDWFYEHKPHNQLLYRKNSRYARFFR